MAIEIEHKFLPANDDWRGQIEHSVRMAQGYLNPASALRDGLQQTSIRVRIAGESAWLNIKSREPGAQRQEFEYAIPVVDAEALLALCVGGRIEKVRHHVRYGAHLWEIDEFGGDNAGLIVAEIELSTPDEVFARPDWLGLDVTDQPRYYNLNLTDRPYSSWSDEERHSCS